MSKVEPDAVVEMLTEMDKPVATLADIADRLDVSKPHLWDYQHILEEDDRLESDKAGRATIWYLTDEYTNGDADVWQEAVTAVAQSLDADRDDLGRDEITRELAHAYTGNQPLGGWQNE